MLGLFRPNFVYRLCDILGYCGIDFQFKILFIFCDIKVKVKVIIPTLWCVHMCLHLCVASACLVQTVASVGRIRQSRLSVSFVGRVRRLRSSVTSIAHVRAVVPRNGAVWPWCGGALACGGAWYALTVHGQR